MTISLSIVSHRQAAHVLALLQDLDRYCQGPLEILVTLNVPEAHALSAAGDRFPVHIVTNNVPTGFGANHNAAFARAVGEQFCVLNPDLRLRADPFPAMLACVADPQVGVCGPCVLSPEGDVEDSAREFPTPRAIIAKAIGRYHCVQPFSEDADRVYPDWVAGMFMLFRTSVYRAVRGFDERYHLYYEDVDLCARLRLAGYEVALCPRAKVVHDARRQSRHSPRHFAWHLASMARFFTSASYHQIMQRRRAARV